MVTDGENYQYSEDNWANPIEVPPLNCYAIIKHDNYISEMETLLELPQNEEI